MKTLRLFGMALCAILISFFYSCSDDDDESPVDLSVYYGTWICTSSTDTPEKGGDAIEGYMVDETITINENGSYTSSSSNIGKSGSWAIKGNTLTATTASGQPIKVTLSMVSSKMVWDGKANGFVFHYVFEKEG